VLLRPRSLEQACQLLAERGDEAMPIAGGTALEVLRRVGLLGQPVLVDIRGLPELRVVEAVDGELRLGATATLSEVQRHPRVRELAPLLCQAYGRVANVRVRNVATVGGNLAYADYRIDPPAALLVLGARVEARSQRGAREIPVRDFFRGPEETALAADELLTAIRVPVPPRGARAVFRKVTSLGENDWPCVGVAALVVEDQLHLGLTAVAPTPGYARVDVGGLDLVRAQDAAESAAVALLDPIADTRGSRRFKERLARVAVRDAVEEAWPQ
jgi:carbon-monoxide dehydrogenase medium subunit